MPQGLTACSDPLTHEAWVDDHASEPPLPQLRSSVPRAMGHLSTLKQRQQSTTEAIISSWLFPSLPCLLPKSVLVYTGLWAKKPIREGEMRCPLLPLKTTLQWVHQHVGVYISPWFRPRDPTPKPQHKASISAH